MNEDIKPKNLKLHDFLARKTAVKLMLSEHIVEKVLVHEKKGVNTAFKQYNQVEVSGFGKFEISQIKLAKEINKAQQILSALQRRHSNLPTDQEPPIELVNKLKVTQDNLDYFRSKVKP